MRDDEEKYEDKEQGSEVDAHVSHAAEPVSAATDEEKNKGEEKASSLAQPERS